MLHAVFNLAYLKLKLLGSYLTALDACLLLGVALELRLLGCCAAWRSVGCLGFVPPILVDRFHCSILTGKYI